MSESGFVSAWIEFEIRNSRKNYKTSNSTCQRVSVSWLSLVVLGKAGFQQITQCRQQPPSGFLFCLDRLVPLVFEQNVQSLGVASDRFDVNFESDHKRTIT